MEILKLSVLFDLIKFKNKVGIFFRHSERFTDSTQILTGNHILLTENGKKTASDLGEKFKSVNNISYYSSPILRCTESLKEFQHGLGRSSVIQNSTVLGDPGIYYDHNSPIDLEKKMLSMGFLNYTLAYLDAGELVGSRPLAVASQELLIFFKNNMQKGLTFFNSHDFLVAAFMKHFKIKELTMSDFVDFLEGCAIVEDCSGNVQFYRFVGKEL